MAADDIRAQIIDALEAKAADHGIDIVDVELTGTSRAPVVSVRLDHADETQPTITLDEVSQQNDWVSAVLDELDPFSGSYTLEVSSPGLDRPLRRLHDFERFAGERVSVVTRAYEGRKRYTGTLAGVFDGRVRLSCDDGDHDFELSEIRSAKIRPQF